MNSYRLNLNLSRTLFTDVTVVYDKENVEPEKITTTELFSNSQNGPISSKPEPKVSLAKQAERKTTMSELAGAANVTDLARKFQTLDQVVKLMRKAGLQSSSLIFGIDYTASNKTQGLKSFNGNSLHCISLQAENPYQRVIKIVGETLSTFNSQAVIPAFGFGDFKTSDHSVFPLKKEGGHCATFEEVLNVYNAITKKVILSGPTNFAPIIYQAIQIYKERPDYYILIIVADGQVTNEPATVQAIVDACEYPISIIVVGVGDGPWGMMNEFDEKLPGRPWDNFNFVNFHMVTDGEKHPETAFAVHALSEIPDQFRTITEMHLL